MTGSGPLVSGCGGAAPGTSRRCRAGAARAARLGPVAEVGHAGQQRRARRAPRRRPARRRAATTPTGLGQVRRAGHVGDHPAGPDRAPAPREQLALQLGQAGDVGRAAAPARLRPAAQRAQPGARRVDEHPVERARQPTAAARAVGGQHLDAAAPPQRPAGPARPGAAPLDRGRARTPAGRRARRAGALPPGPAHRSSQRCVRPVERRAGQRSGDELAALVLHAGAPRSAPTARRAGVAAGRARPRTASTAAGSPPDSSASSARSSPAGPRGAPRARRRRRAARPRVSSTSPPSASAGATIHRGWAGRRQAPSRSAASRREPVEPRRRSRSAATLRSTALTKPRRAGADEARTRSTVVATAACAAPGSSSW